MTKNLMPEIAKMLGVELGEEFKIKGYDGLAYQFVDYGLKLSFQNDIGMTAIPTNVALVNLLNGNDEIIKLPWQPKKGSGRYWRQLNRKGKRDNEVSCNLEEYRFSRYGLANLR